MSYDKELLRRFYEANGYADFRVTSAVAELTPDRNEFFITFTVSEGEQYRFGKGTIDTTFEDFDIKLLEGLITFKEGEVYNADKIDDTVEALTLIAGQFGYAFVDIRPRPRKQTDEKTIDIIFRMKEGPRVYVERIDIIGNNRTLDRVIRRQMKLSEGDAYNRIRLDRSKNFIDALRYFEEVEIEEESGSAADKTVLKVKVKEQPTGEFSFGVGFSSSENIAGDLSISERNLMGRGQTLRFRISGSNRRQQVDISFLEPYLFGRNIGAGFDLYRSTTDYREEAGYDLASTGGAVRTSFPVTEDARLNLLYTYKTDEINAPGCYAYAGSISNAVCSELGQKSTSLISYTYYLDKRNNPVRPTDGYDFMIKQDFAGLGGDSKYVKTELEMTAYKKLFFDDVIGSASWKWGYIEAFDGGMVRLSDRFRKGGNSFRGFDVSGIGPRDVANVRNGKLKFGDSLGGQAYGIGTIEVGFPTGLPETYGLEASAFIEAGTLGYIGDNAQQDILERVLTQNQNIEIINIARVAVGLQPIPLLSLDIGMTCPSGLRPGLASTGIHHSDRFALILPMFCARKSMIERRVSDLVRGEDSRMLKKFVSTRLLSLGVVAMGLVVLPLTAGSSALAADLKVLVVNQGAVFQNSLVGKDETKKIQAIFETIAAEERAEVEPIAKQMQDLQGQRALLGDEFQRKQIELQRKAEYVKYKFDQERKYTQEGAQRLIIQKLYPIFNEIMQEKKGTLLLDQSQVIMTSPDFNITDDVIKRLDARMPTAEVKRITFAEIQKAFEEQQAKLKAAEGAKK